MLVDLKQAQVHKQGNIYHHYTGPNLGGFGFEQIGNFRTRSGFFGIIHGPEPCTVYREGLFFSCIDCYMLCWPMFSFEKQFFSIQLAQELLPLNQSRRRPVTSHDKSRETTPIKKWILLMPLFIYLIDFTRSSSFPDQIFSGLKIEQLGMYIKQYSIRSVFWCRFNDCSR